MSRLPHIMQLLEESPKDPFLRFALAKEYEAGCEHAKALDAWAWFDEHAPDYNGYYYHYGKLLYETGHSTKALEVIARGLAITMQQGDRHAHSELRGLQDMVEGY
jgi:hypothetical protein